MPDTLTRRPAFGEPGRDDWSIICDGVSVGRIYRQQRGLPGPPWHWEIALLSHLGAHRGAVDTYAEARAAFQAGWDQLRGSVQATELRAALEARRRAHAANDAWAERHGAKPR